MPVGIDELRQDARLEEMDPGSDLAEVDSGDLDQILVEYFLGRPPTTLFCDALLRLVSAASGPR